MSNDEYRWLNKHSQKFLEDGYLLEGQTVDERITIIAKRAEKILGIKGYAKKFKENFKKGWYSLSTPVWANFGNDRGLPISCFSSYLEDNLQSILYTNAEVGMMTKYGGGTSAYFGELRPRGSEITNNGKSSGSVHFMQLFDKQMQVISQGSTRRGSFAAYLPIDHPDILEFLKIKSEGDPIQDISFGVCVPDYWMKEMIEGDKTKRKVWAKVLETRANVGYPYIFFTDNANNNKPQVYKDKGLKIHSSNLCITGDQRVVSNFGYLTAKELYELDTELILFDGHKSVAATKMKLRECNVDVYEVKLSNGLTHKITPYHKLLVMDGRGNIEQKECKDLVVGDSIAVQNSKGLFGNTNMPKEAFLLGLYQGDGTQHKDTIMLDLWENNFDLLDEVKESFDYIHYEYGCDQYQIANQYNSTAINRGRLPATFHECSVREGSVRKKRLSAKTLHKALDFQKGVVPDWIWKGDEATQWQYVRGLLYTDGTAQIANGICHVSFSNTNRKFLEELQLLFNNLGLKSSIGVMRNAGQTLLPNGKGGHEFYDTQECCRLTISNMPSALEIEKHTSFLSRKGCMIEDRIYRDNTKKRYKIVSIEYVGKEDVYCPTVKDDGNVFVSQGVLTTNCSEIMLSTNKDESFVCDLSSMNLLYYDEWKDTDAVEVLTYFLDAVMSEFIEKAKDIPFMERTVRFAERHRALGLGVLGYHSLLQSKMIPFESLEAKWLNTEIFKLLQEKTQKASKEMAELFGEPELLKGYGLRNTTLCAVAPTKSSAFILGQVSEGIEPMRSNYFIKDLAKGKFTYKNPYLKQLLKDKGMNNSDVWDSILQKGGSVQHLDFLTEEEKFVFKTFQEISPKEIILQAAQRQQYIDQGQSLNLMIHPKIPTKDVNKLMIEAWELGIKSLYYQFSVNASQEFSMNILECQSCGG